MNLTYLNAHPGVIYGAVGLFCLLVYFVFLRFLTSRNFKPQTPSPGEIPDLPAGLPPAAVCYLKRRGFDSQVLVVALLDMAVRGYLHLHEENGTYSLTRGEASLEALTPDEREIATRLDFRRIPELILGPGNRWIFKKALAAFKKYLNTKYQPFYFRANTRYFILGLIIGLAAITGAGYYGDFQKTAMFLLYCGWVVIWGFAFFILMKQAVASWNAAKDGPRFRFSAIIRFLLSLIFGIGIILVEIYSVSSWLTITTPSIIGIVGAVVLLCLFFRKGLKVYSPTGQEKIVQIAEFRRALAGEATDLCADIPNFPGVSELTPENFSRYLPYAMALEITSEYGRRFNSFSGFSLANLTSQWYSKSKQLNQLTASEFIVSFCQSFSGVITLMLLASGRDK